MWLNCLPRKVGNKSLGETTLQSLPDCESYTDWWIIILVGLKNNCHRLHHFPQSSPASEVKWNSWGFPEGCFPTLNVFINLHHQDIRHPTKCVLLPVVEEKDCKSWVQSGIVRWDCSYQQGSGQTLKRCWNKRWCSLSLSPSLRWKGTLNWSFWTANEPNPVVLKLGVQGENSGHKGPPLFEREEVLVVWYKWNFCTKCPDWNVQFCAYIQPKNFSKYVSNLVHTKFINFLFAVSRVKSCCLWFTIPLRVLTSSLGAQ